MVVFMITVAGCEDEEAKWLDRLDKDHPGLLKPRTGLLGESSAL